MDAAAALPRFRGTKMAYGKVEKIEEVMRRTGCTEDVASEELIAEEWDADDAVFNIRQHLIAEARALLARLAHGDVRQVDVAGRRIKTE
jgi:hypothetical protein